MPPRGASYRRWAVRTSPLCTSAPSPSRDPMHVHRTFATVIGRLRLRCGGGRWCEPWILER